MDAPNPQQALKQFPEVNQDTPVDHTTLELGTPAGHGIFRIEHEIVQIFQQFLVREGFIGIHAPQRIVGALSAKGGSSIFTLDYKGKHACHMKYPEFHHMHLAILSDLERVFEINGLYKPEGGTFTHMHLSGLTGLNVEMEINEHYYEVMDIVDRLFVEIFDGILNKCHKQLEGIQKQFPFEPLKYKRKTLRLTFEEGLQMLKGAGFDQCYKLGVLSTESKRKLGQLVLEKYDTDFYMLHRCPLAGRAFYTMPCWDDATYSNSFDVFLRGEEISSGSQRIYDHGLLVSRAEACGVDMKSMSTYFDSFRSKAACPFAGFGAALERVVMLFCGLNNIS